MISLSPEGTGGGQHHQTSARLTAKAFRLAGDPKSFPDQLGEELRPWQPLRLFQTSLPGQKKSKELSEVVTVEVDLGTLIMVFLCSDACVLHNECVPVHTGLPYGRHILEP